MRIIKQILKTITKYRLSSTLSLISLVVGFLGIIVLTLYVSFESSYDNFHHKRDDIYLMSFQFDGGSFVPIPMSEEIRKEIPEVVNGVICWFSNNSLFYKPDQSRKAAVEALAMDASSEFFTVFDFPLLIGAAETVLAEPNTVVISETLAQKIFQTIDVVGEQLVIDGDYFIISGIMKDMPRNTFLYNDALIAFDKSNYIDNWSEWSFTVFFQLQQGIDKKLIDKKIEELSGFQEILESLNEFYESDKGAIGVNMIPLNKLHYYSRGYNDDFINKHVLDILTVLIAMLLIMSAVNFINFSTSQAPLRAKTLSIQQIVGEKKWKVRAQIMGEAIVLSFIALGLAIAIHHLVFQKIENLFQIRGLSFQGRESYIGLFVVSAILFAVLASVYPARYITSAPISQAVKGKMLFSGKGKRFRSILITVQFVFTIAILATSVIIEKQLRFWNNFDLGLDKENVLYLPLSSALRESYQAFSGEILKNPQITDFSCTQFLPGHVAMGWGRKVDNQTIHLKSWPVDDRFIEFFDLKITQGRSFYAGKSDINNFILNEKAVQQFQWQNPLEKRLPSFGVEGDIIGIVKDFHFESLKEPIEPMLFWLTDDIDRMDYMLIKIQPGNISLVKSNIEKMALKFDPEGTFNVRFLDDVLEKLYGKETRLARFIEFVALWTILLALTGLLGLVVFISRDKVKEIGIRKVNGASVSEVVWLLNKEVFVWLGVAFVIATPIAYYAMSRWLENFAYKTALSWWIFVLSGLISLLVALLTVSWQSWRAAKRNPVESLRYE
ncbi:MAG: FtsX-like permease family protein [Bacteroidales bacterium]|jgi:putative ABC transport system permease protein|nr:ABC transporter permease [Bacteroidales bacterium]MDD3701979.1 ABC transporter permease [Bacteroidales bacterium]MDY0368969.1 ABC transporter permease [Bacteroidales bacterium]